ncbi:MAG: hypothetical protein RI986_1242, partial [Planctomycetota bacterium]
MVEAPVSLVDDCRRAGRASAGLWLHHVHGHHHIGELLAHLEYTGLLRAAHFDHHLLTVDYFQCIDDERWLEA